MLKKVMILEFLKDHYGFGILDTIILGIKMQTNELKRNNKI